MNIDRVIDLRGEVCPFTFVKSKLAIEEMKIGTVLKVKLDFPRAAENVPESMENIGQDVIRVEETSRGEWEILIKKRAIVSAPSKEAKNGENQEDFC